MQTREQIEKINDREGEIDCEGEYIKFASKNIPELCTTALELMDQKESLWENYKTLCQAVDEVCEKCKVEDLYELMDRVKYLEKQLLACGHEKSLVPQPTSSDSELAYIIINNLFPSEEPHTNIREKAELESKVASIIFTHNESQRQRVVKIVEESQQLIENHVDVYAAGLKGIDVYKLCEEIDQLLRELKGEG